MTPVMYRIEVGGVAYTDAVKKFAVSRDGVLAALVTSSNQILVYKVRRIRKKFIASFYFYV